MNTEKFLLLASESTHFIMKLEKDLQNFEIWCKIIPLPSEVSAGCGLSIRAKIEDKDKIEKILVENEIIVDKYIVEKKGLKKSLCKL